jgi:hypothetical protein
MSRKKTDITEDLELEPQLDEETSDANELSLDEEISEDTVKIELPKKEPVKRRRSPRKPAAVVTAAHPLNTMSKSAEEAVEVSEPTAPKRSRKEPVVKADLALNKKIAELEKKLAEFGTSTAAPELPSVVVAPPLAPDFSNSIFVQPATKTQTVVVQKASPLTRVAAVASFAAFIFSLLSLSLSQNARQAALSAQLSSTVGFSENFNQSQSRNRRPVERVARVEAVPPAAAVAENSTAPKINLVPARPKSTLLFPFEMPHAHPKPKPEIARAESNSYKPRAPITLYRRMRSAQLN